MANPRKQPVFEGTHHTEIAFYHAAERYLKEIMNGKTTIPIQAWKDERAKLAAEIRLNSVYAYLKEEVQQVEVIRRNVESVLHDEALRQRRIARTEGNSVHNCLNSGTTHGKYSSKPGLPM